MDDPARLGRPSDRLRVSRRVALIGLSAVAAGCGGGRDFAAVAEEVWAPLALDRVDIEGELIRAATLAANSHNTQPWIFERAWPRIVIYPDFSRRTPVVDPDDHHLWASLGCATENLVAAARAAGFEPDVAPPSPAQQEIRIDMALTRPVEAQLAPAITLRRSVRAAFDGKAIAPAAASALEAAGRTRPNVALITLTERAKLDALRDYVIEGSNAQVADPAFVRELRTWLRFDEASAARRRDGLYSGATGAPDAPDWLGGAVFPHVFRAETEMARYRAQIDSTPFAAVFVAERDDLTHWFEAGRAAQRLTLQAAALGLKSAWINQPVEVKAVRGQFAAWLGIGARRPNLILRVGAGPDTPPSLRRPVEAVIRA